MLNKEVVDYNFRVFTHKDSIFYYHLNIYSSSLELLNQKILNYVSKFSHEIDDSNLDSIFDTSELFEKYSQLITYNSYTRSTDLSLNRVDKLDDIIEWLDFENEYLSDLNSEKISNVSESIIQSKNMIRSISEALTLTFEDDDEEKFIYSEEFLKEHYNISLMQNSFMNKKTNIQISYPKNYQINKFIQVSFDEIEHDLIDKIEEIFRENK